MADDILQIKSIKVNATEWLFQNPNYFEYKILYMYKPKNSISRLYLYFVK